MPPEIINATKQRMEKAIASLRAELAKFRTGRASAALLDGIKVDAYGSPMPVNQVGTVSVPESRLLVISPWDKTLIGEIEKAILKSDLGLNPSNDGKVVRIPIPPLNDERRKELSRHVHKMTEEARNHVRTVRRDANDKLKRMLRDHQISEDDEKRALAEVQKTTDEHVKAIDELQHRKDAELLSR